MLFEGKNIGVFKEVKLEIPKLTLLAGCNGSGKSTISKIIYLLLNGGKKFDNYLSNELLHQLDDFEKKVEKEHSISSKENLLNNIGLPNNPTNNELNELKAKIHNNILDDNIVKEILMLFTNNITYADSKDIDLLQDFLSNNYDSQIGKIILPRMIDSEFGNQLCNFNSNNMSVSIKNKTSKSFINLSDKSYTFNFSNFNISSIYYFGSSSALERTGFMLSEYSLRYFNFIQTDHIIDLITSFSKTNSNLSVKDEIEQKDFTEKFDVILQEIIGGGFEYDKESKKIFYNDGDNRVNLKNVASGAKALGTLELLIKNGSIDQNSMIIFDEPENNLHPMWQVKFAKFIVELIAKTSIKVFINSHSPYFIDAINQISSKYEVLDNQIKYYQTNFVDDKYVVKDCSDNINEIFVKLAEPYNYLEKELI